MKNVLVYLLLFATLLPSISPLGTIAYYHTNRDYIARVLCENRDKPQLHCDGKCYLAKKLKATQDRRDKQTTERVQTLPTMQLFCEDKVTFAFAPVWLAVAQSAVPAYLLPDYTAPLAGLLRPPRA